MWLSCDCNKIFVSTTEPRLQLNSNLPENGCKHGSFVVEKILLQLLQVCTQYLKLLQNSSMYGYKNGL